MSNDSSSIQQTKNKRRRIFQTIVDEFGHQYGWLGAQAARELLLSAASWNLAHHSDPPYRVRMHVMLAWKRGWLKSTILKKMVDILGDEFCGMTGKVTAAALRGSVASGQFSPPKVCKHPTLVSTEFGQTQFEDELLNTFLALLEEGVTNVNLNKIGGVSDTQKDKVTNDFAGISFGSNEFTVQTNFVFWGGTYDPTTLQDDALRQRFKIVTPAKPLDKHGHEIIDHLEENTFSLSSDVIKEVRKELTSDVVTKTSFTTPTSLRKKHNLEPRELGDLKRYMACRNWWGLDVNPEIMDEYIQHAKQSRRIARMNKEDRIMDLILDNPMSYEQIMDKTGYSKLEVFKLLNKVNASRQPSEGQVKFVLHSGDKTLMPDTDDEDESDDDDSTDFQDLVSDLEL